MDEPTNVVELNRAAADAYWSAHFQRDWDAMGGFFTADVHYDDIGCPGDGAQGREEIVSMLRLGLEPLEAYIHHPQRSVAEDDTVVTIHMEEWRFHTGERILHPYVSVFVFRDGKIAVWHDYSNIPNITENVPQWWTDQVAKGWQ